MRFRHLDLNLLVALDALLTHQHVTRAAQHLGVTQSGMSGALARLREHFNDQLLVRIGRRNILTPLAARLLGPLREILLQTDTLLANQPAFNPAIAERKFTVVCSDYVSEVLINRVAPRLAAEAPSVTLYLEAIRDESLRRFHNGDYEFLIVRDELGGTEYPRAPLFQDTYVCVVWTGNTLVGEALSIEDYLSLRHVEGFKRGEIHKTWEDQFYGGIGQRKTAIVAATSTGVPRMVVGTNFIATTHARTARDYARHLPIRLLPTPIQFPILTEVLLWHRHQAADAAVTWLRGLFSDVARELEPVF